MDIVPGGLDGDGKVLARTRTSAATVLHTLDLSVGHPDPMTGQPAPPDVTCWIEATFSIRVDRAATYRVLAGWGDGYSESLSLPDLRARGSKVVLGEGSDYEAALRRLAQGRGVSP